jgi:hypothetical protein
MSLVHENIRHMDRVKSIIDKAKHRELVGEIKWFESLLECLEDDEIEDAIKSVESAINLKRKQLAEV